MEDKYKHWLSQLDELCKLFEFEPVDDVRTNGRQLILRKRLKCGRAHVMYKDKKRTMSSGELEAMAELPLGRKDLCSAVAAHELVKLLSGKELIVRATEEPRKTKYGFTKVRTERHILLSEFSSFEELRLKLEVLG